MPFSKTFRTGVSCGGALERSMQEHELTACESLRDVMSMGDMIETNNCPTRRPAAEIAIGVRQKLGNCWHFRLEYTKDVGVRRIYEDADNPEEVRTTLSGCRKYCYCSVQISRAVLRPRARAQEQPVPAAVRPSRHGDSSICEFYMRVIYTEMSLVS